MPHLFTFDALRVDDHDGNDDGWWAFPGSSKPSADVAQADDDNNDTGDQMALDFGGA